MNNNGNRLTPMTDATPGLDDGVYDLEWVLDFVKLFALAATALVHKVLSGDLNLALLVLLIIVAVLNGQSLNPFS